MKYLSQIALLVLLTLTQCTTARVNKDPFQYAKQAGFLAYISTAHWNTFGRWPTSIEQLKTFAKANDSLQSLCDSLAGDLRAYFYASSRDSLHIRIATDDPHEYFAFSISPNSRVRVDTTHARFQIIFRQ